MVALPRAQPLVETDSHYPRVASFVTFPFFFSFFLIEIEDLVRGNVSQRKEIMYSTVWIVRTQNLVQVNFFPIFNNFSFYFKHKI